MLSHDYGEMTPITAETRQIVLDEKLSTMEDGEIENPEVRVTSTPHRKISQLVYFGLLALVIFYLAWTTFASSRSISRFDTDLVERKVVEVSKYRRKASEFSGQDPMLKVQQQHQFDFNVTTGKNDLQSWELLQSSSDESQKHFGGKITVDRGNEHQSSDITVVVIVRSSNNASLYEHAFHRTDSGLNIEYNNAITTEDLVYMEVLVYLRPWPKRSLNFLTIQTSKFDIWITESPTWSFNNLILHTNHGEIAVDSNPQEDTYLAKNVSASSTHGPIFGSFVADEYLQLRNEHGIICAFLTARHSLPFEPKSISIYTHSGDIFVAAAQQAWPVKSYTHHTDVRSVSGAIYAQVAHGSFTDISTFDHGKIVAYIKPYAVSDPDAPSEIYTETYSGTISVWVSDPVPDAYNTFSPLCNTVSEHRVAEGSLDVRYGGSWYGDMEGGVRRGGWEVRMSPEEMHSGHDGDFRFERGEGGKSRMRVVVDFGKGDVFVQIGGAEGVAEL